MEELTLGRMSMSEQELDRISLRSLMNKITGYQAADRDKWERVRIMSFLMLQPHIDQKKSLTPAQILPFPWDNEITSNILEDAKKAAERRKELFDKIDRAEQNENK